MRIKLISVLLIFLISSCSPSIQSPIATIPPIGSVVAPMATATEAATPTATKIPDFDLTPISAPEQRQPVALADVTNVEPSMELKSAGVGPDGHYYPANYPPNTNKIKSDIDARFNALLQKFGPDVKVYFNQDTTGSDQWVLYAENVDPKNGNVTLIHQVSRYPANPGQNASMQPSDRPVQYKKDESGSLIVVGQYMEFDIPGNQATVAWTGSKPDLRLPNFLADPIILNGIKYNLLAMKYEPNGGSENVWGKITGVSELVATESAKIVSTFAPELSGEQLAEKNIIGSGFELTDKYQGKDSPGYNRGYVQVN